MNVFELFAKLSLDSSEYQEGLSDAENSASSFGSKLKTGIGVAAGVTTAAITATTAATVAGTKAFIDGVSSVAQYGDNIDKMSQKMNISAEAYQEWDFIMQHCGTSMSTLKASMKTLATQATSNTEIFEELGISQEEVANMSQEDLFAATISSLQNMEDETQRTYYAGKLLGRGATELGALFNMTAEETEDMRQQVHDLGGVLSDDAVKDAARFQDSLQNMSTAFDGMKRNMLTNFLPAFSTVMDGLSLVFSGDSDSGLGLVESGVKDLAENISKVAPIFIQVGGTILQALATAIAENAPALIESGIEAIGKFVDGIIDNADGIFEAAEKVITMLTDKLIDPAKAAKFTQVAINLIVKLANGISQALPQLIPAIVSVVVEIVRVLTRPDNIALLIQCAITLIMALMEGIIEAIPTLIGIIPEVIVNLVTAIIENFPLILETSLELLGMLGLALLQALAALMGTSLEEVGEGLQYGMQVLSDWGKGILDWLKNGWSKITSGISNAWNSITGFFTRGFANIKKKVTDGLDNIKSKFTNIFENVKTTVQNAIEFLKGLFKFDWELPKIKLPHFSVEGSFNLDPTNFSLPKINVEWYKKAMNTPYMLEDATIFGAAGGKMLGGGESGRELVYSHEQLLADIGAVIDARLQNMQFVVPVYIGGKKIDQQIVIANARNAVISGGR